MKNNKGISNLLILVSLVTLIGVAGSIFFYFQNKNNKKVELKTPVTKTESQKTLNEKENEAQTCATEDMFSNEPSKILEPLSQEEIKNMSDFAFDYLNIISFYGNQGDLILNVSGAEINSKDELYIANKLVPGDPGSYLTSSYDFRKSGDCLPPIYPHQLEAGVKIKKLSIKDRGINILEVPGCCTGYNYDVTYFLELNEEYQKRVNAKYIQITPWYYDLKEFEKVLRSLKFITVDNSSN